MRIVQIRRLRSGSNPGKDFMVHGMLLHIRNQPALYTDSWRMQSHGVKMLAGVASSARRAMHSRPRSRECCEMMKPMAKAQQVRVCTPAAGTLQALECDSEAAPAHGLPRA
jgi:hypothetical protein